MRFYVTRKTLVWIVISLLAALVLVATFGCTKRQEAAAKTTGGVVAGLFGLPPGVGESLVGAVLAIGSYVGGKKHGRHCERRKACALPKATT